MEQVKRRNSVTGRRLKGALRNAYESKFAAPLRLAHFYVLYRREVAITRRVAADLGFPIAPLDQASEGAPRESATLFIFGSGPSANLLATEQLEEICKSDSIGINAWIGQRNSAGAYSFEADGLDEPPSPELVKMSAELAKKAKSQPGLKLFLLRPKRVDLAKRLVRVPGSLVRNSIMYGRVNLTTRALANVEPDLVRILRMLSHRKGRISALPDNGASVVRLICLGAILGYEKIVLLGIDLKHSVYFWEHESFAGNAGDYASFRRPSGALHDTLDTADRPFSTLDFIPALGNAIWKVFGSQVLLGTKESALEGLLPDFLWASNAHRLDQSDIPRTISSQC